MDDQARRAYCEICGWDRTHKTRDEVKRHKKTQLCKSKLFYANNLIRDHSTLSGVSFNSARSKCTSTCSRALCSRCDGCVERHCTCYPKDSNKRMRVSLESRACDCVTSSQRCVQCHGCVDYHCKCKSNTTTSTTSTTKIMSKECWNKELQKFPIPSLESRFDLKIGDNITDGIPYDLSLYHQLDTSSNNSTSTKNKYPVKYQRCVTGKTDFRHTMSSSTLMTSVFPEYSGTMVTPANFSPWVSIAGNRGEGPMQFINRMFENIKTESDIRNAYPNEELVDYIVNLASVMITKTPELIGMFESTAASAVAVVVEEFIKQVQEEKSTSVRSLDKVLRECVSMNYTEDEVVEAVAAVFGKEFVKLNQGLILKQLGKLYECAEYNRSVAAAKNDSDCTTNNNNNNETTSVITARDDTEWVPRIGTSIYECKSLNVFGNPSYGVRASVSKKGDESISLLIKDQPTLQDAVEMHRFLKKST